MPVVRLREAARRDLVEHFVYLAENAGLDVAERFLSNAEATFGDLAQQRAIDHRLEHLAKAMDRVGAGGILARLADGLIVVARCQATTRAELQRSLSLLRQGDNNLLGVILNEVDTRQERYEYGGDYYTYRAPATGSDPAE